MNSNELIKKAQELAYDVLRDSKCILTQKNKLEHTESVVKKAQELGTKDDNLIILAYLHDVIDYGDEIRKKMLIQKIADIFGTYMLKLVEEVSDYFKMEDIGKPLGDELLRKRIVQIKSPEAISSTSAKIILAEKVCNLNDILNESRRCGRTYWEDLKKNYNLKKLDIREYYELIYDILADRCYGDKKYGDRSLQKMIDEYDYLLFKIFD